MTYFEPPCAPPPRFPSPFGEPHAIARHAAERLADVLPRAGEGKMYGVLVVADRGRIGFLRAFSGMLDGRWELDDFAPPAFDLAARDAFWPAGERELAELDARLAALRADPAHDERATVVARLDRELAALREQHRERRARRHALRERTPALDRESRGDGAQRRRFDAARRAELAPLDARAGELARVIGELEATKAGRSRELLHRIQATYALANARGERRPLRELFAPAEPPGGAGDCAAPKLLAHAYRLGMTPLALAEMWWGPPPASGDRRAGRCYPACRGKCGPILAHMLGGLDAEPPPVFGAAPSADTRRLHEDAWLIVVAKPVGLLSVPGRGDALRDSVLVRLRAQHPDATVVHRLDLDTSGVLLAAKDAATHAALQRQFAQREIDKRYVAWLDGDVGGDAGSIELALRVDVDDRPRQIVDPVHGKPALTEWRVLARAGGRTKVAFTPRTGRTHQLRVHAAVGLGAPIAGDRLYGTPGPRLLLHAESLAFTHPHTGERIAIADPAPF